MLRIELTRAVARAGQQRAEARDTFSGSQAVHCHLSALCPILAECMACDKAPCLARMGTQMQLSFGKGLIAGAAGLAVVLAVTAAANGIGVGTAFILGKTNTVNATSTLTGKTQGPMLNVINSGSGTALNLKVGSGHPPFSVNSATKVANLNASLLGGIGPAGFVQGGGRVATAEVELTVGQTVPLLNLPGYGQFSVTCLNVPFAEVDFTVGPHNVHLWTQDIAGSSPGVSEQDLGPGSGLGFQTGVSAEQIQWTVQDASSASLSGHLATVQTDEAVNGNNTNKCDFAAFAYAAP
jgi:hypothetical protein